MRTDKHFYEKLFDDYWRANRGTLPNPVENHRFLFSRIGRKFELDRAWIPQKVAVEIQGGIWAGKHSHASGAGITRDIEKHNLALLDGWALLLFSTKMLNEAPFQVINSVKHILRARLVHGELIPRDLDAQEFNDVLLTKHSEQQKLKRRFQEQLW